MRASLAEAKDKCLEYGKWYDYYTDLVNSLKRDLALNEPTKDRLKSMTAKSENEKLRSETY